MADTSEERQERLSSIWNEWGLQPETTTGDALMAALDVADAWLDKGDSEPEIVLRAVQILLVDPERPDAHKRPCWASLRKAIRNKWGSAMTAPEHVLYGQALVLAVWPEASQGKWFFLAPLLDSAWDLVAGRERQRNEITRWREGARLLARRNEQQGAIPGEEQEEEQLDPYKSVDLSTVSRPFIKIGRAAALRSSSRCSPRLSAH
jgi:hypothetical protein